MILGIVYGLLSLGLLGPTFTYNPSQKTPIVLLICVCQRDACFYCRQFITHDIVTEEPMECTPNKIQVSFCDVYHCMLWLTSEWSLE